MIFSFRAD